MSSSLYLAALVAQRILEVLAVLAGRHFQIVQADQLLQRRQLDPCHQAILCFPAALVGPVHRLLLRDRTSVKLKIRKHRTQCVVS